jgi:vancomycin permeability regulator SanA
MGAIKAKRVARWLGASLFASIALAVVVNAVVLHGGDDGKVAGVADCAVVLGARVYEDGTPSEVLRDRLDEALVLWREHRVKRIVVSGDHATSLYDEPNAMRAYLEARGVPPEIIFMDHAGFDTYSSMWRAKHVFGATRIVVVTQRFHLPRALWVARSLGMEAEGRAADHHVYRSIAWMQMREIGSRTKAFLDVTVRRTPHKVGPRIDLEGDGRVTAG